MMTEQEIFDKAYKGMLEQQAFATHPNGDCCYYEPHTGNRCHVGLLVDPEEAEQLELKHQNMSARAVANEIGLAGHEIFLEALQDVHDNLSTTIFDLLTYQSRMQRFAASRNLEFKP